MGHKKNKKGFSLVELVVAVAIMGMITSVLVPSLLKIMQEKRKSADDMFLEQISTDIKSALTDQAALKEAQKISEDGGETIKITFNVDPYGNMDLYHGWYGDDSEKEINQTNLGLDIITETGNDRSMSYKGYYNCKFIYTVTLRTDSQTTKVYYTFKNN